MDFPQTEKCKICKGHCCGKSAGLFHPDQVKGRIKTLIDSKLFAIDYWEGSPPIYYLRPRHINAPFKIIDASWGGTCVFLTDEGCRLPREKRPAQCLTLEVDPSAEGFECKQHFPKEDVVKLWKNNQAEILAIVDLIHRY